MTTVEKKDGRVAPQDSLWGPEETAEYLKVPVGTLSQWRYRGVGPRSFRVGRHVRYRKADIDSWLDRLA